MHIYMFIREENFTLAAMLDARWTTNGNLDVVNFSARNLSPRFCGANEIEIFYLSLDTWKNFSSSFFMVHSIFIQIELNRLHLQDDFYRNMPTLFFAIFCPLSRINDLLIFSLYLDSRGISHFMIIVIFIMLLLTLLS